MTESSILKGVLAGAAALAMTGVVLAQVATGTPSSGTGIGVTPPPSSGATNDTSRLATDCDKVAADMRSNTPPHLAMGCDKSATTSPTAATGATAPPATAMGAAGARSTATAAPDINTMPQSSKPATKLAKADRG